jgi:hypothetical protein
MAKKAETVEVDPPRELTAWERGVLAKMLEVEFEGAGGLRDQLAHTRVSDESTNSGFLALGLEVDRTKAKPARDVRWRVPVLAEARDADEMEISFLLFVNGGCLSSLELFRQAGDDPFQQLPDPAELLVTEFQLPTGERRPIVVGQPFMGMTSVEGHRIVYLGKATTPGHVNIAMFWSPDIDPDELPGEGDG